MRSLNFLLDWLWQGGEDAGAVARRADRWNFNSCTVEEYAHELAIQMWHNREELSNAYP